MLQCIQTAQQPQQRQPPPPPPPPPLPPRLPQGLFISSPVTRYLSLVSFPLQTLQGTLLRMKERYLNVPVCPGEKSHSAVVRASVLFGKGKRAAPLAPALRSEQLPGLQGRSPIHKQGKAFCNFKAPDSRRAWVWHLWS